MHVRVCCLYERLFVKCDSFFGVSGKLLGCERWFDAFLSELTCTCESFFRGGQGVHESFLVTMRGYFVIVNYFLGWGGER